MDNLTNYRKQAIKLAVVTDLGPEEGYAARIPGFPGLLATGGTRKKYLPIWMMRLPIGSRWRSSGALVFRKFETDRGRLALLKPLVTRDSSFLQDKF